MRMVPFLCLVDTLRKSGTNPGVFYLVATLPSENLDQLQRTGVRIYRVTSTSGETNGLVMAERTVFTCPATAPCSQIAAEIARAKRRTA